MVTASDTSEPSRTGMGNMIGVIQRKTWACLLLALAPMTLIFYMPAAECLRGSASRLPAIAHSVNRPSASAPPPVMQLETAATASESRFRVVQFVPLPPQGDNRKSCFSRNLRLSVCANPGMNRGGPQIRLPSRNSSDSAHWVPHRLIAPGAGAERLLGGVEIGRMGSSVEFHATVMG